MTVENVKVSGNESLINGLIEQHAKLNELKPTQMEVVRELVNETFTLGIKTGVEAGTFETGKELSQVYTKMMLIRTFYISMTSVFVLWGLIKLTETAPLVFFLVGLINTTVWLLADIVIGGIKSKLKK